MCFLSRDTATCYYHVIYSSHVVWWPLSCARDFDHYPSREVSCGMLTKVCRARRNYLKLSCFLHYPLTAWNHIFTGCSQGGKVTFENTWCTFNNPGVESPLTSTPTIWLVSPGLKEHSLSLPEALLVDLVPALILRPQDHPTGTPVWRGWWWWWWWWDYIMGIQPDTHPHRFCRPVGWRMAHVPGRNKGPGPALAFGGPYPRFN